MESTQVNLQQLETEHKQTEEELQQREQKINLLNQEKDDLEHDLEEIKREFDREKDLGQQMERTYGESVSLLHNNWLFSFDFSTAFKNTALENADKNMLVDVSLSPMFVRI